MKLKRKKPAAIVPAKRNVGAATFSVDDTGHLRIRDGQQVIDLERADVRRLRAFLFSRG